MCVAGSTRRRTLHRTVWWSFTAEVGRDFAPKRCVPAQNRIARCMVPQPDVGTGQKLEDFAVVGGGGELCAAAMVAYPCYSCGRIGVDGGCGVVSVEQQCDRMDQREVIGDIVGPF